MVYKHANSANAVLIVQDVFLIHANDAMLMKLL